MIEKNGQDRINAYLDAQLGVSDGFIKSARPNAAMSNHTYRQYKSSFLTMGDMEIPDDYRELFRWCRYYFKFDPVIGATIRALATFPVTEIIFNDRKSYEDEKQGDDTKDERSPEYNFYTNMFKELGLYQHLIEIGIDYYLYGNCVIFAQPGYKTVKYRDKLDGIVKERKELTWRHLERLDMTRLRMDIDPKTKEKLYYYDVPAHLKSVIKSKRPKEKYDRIPEIFKEAVRKKKLLKLNQKFVFHFKFPSESGDSDLLATPPVAHGIKLLLYRNVLRQAQEAIAYEHIVPRRVYYFENTQDYSPNLSFDNGGSGGGGGLAASFAQELRKQLNDPNYSIVSPIPVQMVQHGGMGRSLLLVPEIEQIQDEILAALGVPREFVFGGMSYSGSTTSLRILENHFITYRILQHEYINEFLIKRLAQLRGEWDVPEDDDKLVKADQAELKMQDDVQQKNLMIEMNQAGKIPDETLYEKVFGLEYEGVKKQLEQEQIYKLEQEAKVQKMQIEQNAELHLYQVEVAQKLGLPLEQSGEEENPEAQMEEFPQQEPSADGAAAQENAQGPGPQTIQVDGQTIEVKDQPQYNGNMSDQQAVKIAQQLVNASEIEVGRALKELPEVQKQKVMTYIILLRRQNEGTGINMDPYPEKLPPRREGGV